MTAFRPRRSALYLPASNARAVEKARSLPCDAVILDLEDAVAPDAKVTARVQAVEAVQAGGFGGREVIVRINGLETPWGAADLGAVSAARPDAILVPKVSRPSDLAAYREALGEGPALWAMVETCQAILGLEALGQGSVDQSVGVWVLGTNDLAKEMRARLDGERRPLQPALALTVAAARAHGLVVLDGVFNDIADTTGLEAQCRQGLEFGFDGKTLIHPSQIEAANRAFSPEPEAIAWAHRVVTAFETPGNEGKGVLQIDGRMAERLHLEEARRVLALSAVVASMETA